MKIDLNGLGITTALSVYARTLIAKGASRDELAEWVRGETEVFTTSRTLGWWADHELRAGRYYLIEEAKALKAPR